MVGDAARCRGEPVVETVLVADRPQELRWVRHRVGQPLGPFPVLGGHQFGVLAAKHHRTRRIDGQDLLAGVDVWPEPVEVRGGPFPKGVEIARLPGRHAAAGQALLTCQVHAVAFQHSDRVVPDLGFVVLHVTGREEDGFAFGRIVVDEAASSGPGGEGGSGEAGEVLVAVDAQHLFQEDPMDPTACVGHVGQTT